MTSPATTPVTVLSALATSDPTRPRLTWYDDADGPTRGERIELSGRVLANWVAKTANLLVDELGVEPAETVVLDLPAHWRGVYWALAVWRAGATVSLQADDAASVVVTDRPDAVRAGGATLVVAVSLPALARRWAGELPAGAFDEAADLLSQPDVFEPFDEPPDDDVALRAGATESTGAELGAAAEGLAAQQGWASGERVAVTPPAGARLDDDGGRLLVALLAAWSVDGSVVLARDADASSLADRWAAERVTSAWPPAGTPASRP